MLRGVKFISRHPDIKKYFISLDKKIDLDQVTVGSYAIIKYYCFGGCGKKNKSIVRSFRSGKCWKCSYNPEKREETFLKKGNSLDLKYPDVAKYLNKTKNKKKHYQILFKSTKEFWWDCKLCGKPFKRKVLLMTAKDTIGLCKDCKYISVANSHLLNSKEKYGTLDQYKKEVQAHFDFEKNKKKPSEINVNSKENIYIKCKFGHSRKRLVYLFVKNPVCTGCVTNTSRLEVRVYSELHKYFKSLKWQHKIKGIEFDILLKIKNNLIAIEIDGGYWHKNKYIKELKKNKFAKNNKIFLIRFRSGSLKKISNSYYYNEKENDLTAFIGFCQFLKNKSKIEPLIKFSDFWLKRPIFKNDKEYKKILERLPSPPKHKSFAFNYPKLAKEWSNKNLPLTPFDITPSTHRKFKWRCLKSKFHDDYLMYPRHKTEGKGCNACAGYIAAPDNNFLFLKPKSAKYWDYKKNYPIKPQDVVAGSTSEYWFLCKNNHSRKKSLRSFKNKIPGRAHCIECFSLSFLFPTVAQEWDFSKNKKDPRFVKAHSNEVCWWICSKCKTSFDCAVGNRTDKKRGIGSGCPTCGLKQKWITRRKRLKKKKNKEKVKTLPMPLTKHRETRGGINFYIFFHTLNKVS